MENTASATGWKVLAGALATGVAVYAGIAAWSAVFRPPPTDLGIGMQLLLIRAGTFRMGARNAEWSRQQDEVPQRTAAVRRRFYIGAHEVTQRQWATVMGNNPSHFQGDDRPVERVSYHDALTFCKKLSRRTGRTVRLPTEAEWEYACRAGTTTRYAFGDTLAPEQARHTALGTAPVGSSPPNDWVAYDMHGNVWEWCEGAYKPSGKNNKTKRRLRVVRGGSWLSDAQDCRSASRAGVPPAVRCSFIGFRVVVER